MTDDQLPAVVELYTISNNDNTLHKTVKGATSYYNNKSGGWVDIFIALVGSYGQLVGLPAVLIVLANTTVFLHLRVKKTKLSDRAKSALAMVSASSIVSLLMMLVAGYAITQDYVKLEDTNYTAEKNKLSNSLYRMLAQLMIGMTNSTNFFIYIASSSAFRQCFLAMVGVNIVAKGKVGQQSRGGITRQKSTNNSESSIREAKQNKDNKNDKGCKRQAKSSESN
ncbi:uncharacterized protein LOC142335015 [Convolutriloba macropyga]|uniref:uncharacterized protein LOC142335015 n=1 Tax=Convolutriloba macropyga TaxID=536237 RepID=UPI003F51B198